MLKSITQAKFEFFEAFAENFKKTLYELITKPNANKNTNWMNKYVFKIIEKCLIKLTNIEKDFIANLSKVCHSIIDVFLLKQNMKLIKLYQLSMRLIYIIYDRRREKNSKVIKFFMEKFTPILTMSKITDEFISELLNDFIEVNFSILSKSKDLEDFYKMFFIFLGNDNKKENSMKYMKSIEKLFQYEMEKSNNKDNNVNTSRSTFSILEQSKGGLRLYKDAPSELLGEMINGNGNDIIHDDNDNVNSNKGEITLKEGNVKKKYKHNKCKC
jgi:hypothetical protein